MKGYDNMELDEKLDSSSYRISKFTGSVECNTLVYVVHLFNVKMIWSMKVILICLIEGIVLSKI